MENNINDCQQNVNDLLLDEENIMKPIYDIVPES